MQKYSCLIPIIAFSCLGGFAHGAIAYTDLATGAGFEAYDSGNSQFTTFATYVAGADTNGFWRSRTDGPANNANSTTAYQSLHSNNAPQIRYVYSGLNASTAYEFFVYTMHSGGSADFQAAVSTNTTSTTEYTVSLFVVQGGGGVQVLSDGSEGIVGSGDQRWRRSLGTFSGSTSYALILDDFNPSPGSGDRVVFDGIGIQTVPEPSSLFLSALGLAGLLARRRRRE